ncbi:hypothetical protein D3C86_1976440 [compost metagenome]
MFAGVDALRLFHGAVIHPDDDIAFGMIGSADRQSLVISTTHDKRTGRVETDAGNLSRIDTGA